MYFCCGKVNYLAKSVSCEEVGEGKTRCPVFLMSARLNAGSGRCPAECAEQSLGSLVCIASEGLVIIAIRRPVPKDLTDFAIGALFSSASVVRRVRRFVRRLSLGWTIFSVVEIEAVTDVAEKARFLLGLVLFLTVKTKKSWQIRLDALLAGILSPCFCLEQ